jgi:hypothetical protein
VVPQWYDPAHASVKRKHLAVFRASRSDRATLRARFRECLRPQPLA